MMSQRDQPVLMWVYEIGGYPDFTALARSSGYRVVKLHGVRKALKALQACDPRVLIAEFNYSPTYGARISPVEPLLARLQSHHPDTALLLLAEPDARRHLPTLEPQYGRLEVLTFPIDAAALRRWLAAVA